MKSRLIIVIVSLLAGAAIGLTPWFLRSRQASPSSAPEPVSTEVTAVQLASPSAPPDPGGPVVGSLFARLDKAAKYTPSPWSPTDPELRKKYLQYVSEPVAPDSKISPRWDGIIQKLYRNWECHDAFTAYPPCSLAFPVVVPANAYLAYSF